MLLVAGLGTVTGSWCEHRRGLGSNYLLLGRHGRASRQDPGIEIAVSRRDERRRQGLKTWNDRTQSCDGREIVGGIPIHLEHHAGIEYQKSTFISLEAGIEIGQHRLCHGHQALLDERGILGPIPGIEHERHQLRSLVPGIAPPRTLDVANLHTGAVVTVFVNRIGPEHGHGFGEVSTFGTIPALGSSFREGQSVLIQIKERIHHVPITRW